MCRRPPTLHCLKLKKQLINKSFDQARLDFVAGESTDTEIEIYLGHARPSSLFWWCRGE